MALHDSEHEKVYATGGRRKVPIYVTGVVNVENSEVVVLDSDLGSVETKKKWDLILFVFHAVIHIFMVINVKLVGDNTCWSFVINLNENIPKKKN